MIGLLFRILDRKYNLDVFVKNNKHFITEYLFYLFSPLTNVVVQQLIMHGIYIECVNTEDYSLLKDSLIRITCFRTKKDYIKLVEPLNNSETEVRALEIIKNISMYYLVDSLKNHST